MTHVSVSDLCSPRIGLHISSSRIGRPMVGIYKSLTDAWMWKLGLRPRYSFFGNIYFETLVFCLCSVRSQQLPIWVIRRVFVLLIQSATPRITYTRTWSRWLPLSLTVGVDFWLRIFPEIRRKNCKSFNSWVRDLCRTDINKKLKNRSHCHACPFNSNSYNNI